MRVNRLILPCVFKKLLVISEFILYFRAMTTILIDSILQFWFGDLKAGQVDPAIQKRWFKKDSAFDQAIKDQFAAPMQVAAEGGYNSWQAQASGSLALLILLDQFPRNVYRESPQAWATDPKAQQITLTAIKSQQDQELWPIQRVFLYMPLMHAEDRLMQQNCVDLFAQMVQDSADQSPNPYQNNLDFAKAHADIIERFGRFPHRNIILGRETTAAESRFLETHSGF